MLALMAFSSIANAAVKTGTSRVSANFEVISPCTVTGSWATTPIQAGDYPAWNATLGTLTLTYTGCDGSSYPYIEGTMKDLYGRMLASGPGGSTIPVTPTPDGAWLLKPDINDGVFIHFEQIPGNGTGSTSVTLTNGDRWDAQPGDYILTLNIGTYSD